MNFVDSFREKVVMWYDCVSKPYHRGWNDKVVVILIPKSHLSYIHNSDQELLHSPSLPGLLLFL